MKGGTPPVGGTSPLVVTALIGATGNVMTPAHHMMAAAVVGGFAVWQMAESAGRPLPGSAPAVAEEGAVGAVRDRATALVAVTASRRAVSPSAPLD